MQVRKYRNIKVVYDGITFASIKEKNRYIQLKLLEKSGKIQDLVIQPKFCLQQSFSYKGKKYRGINYYADFGYKIGSQRVIEDVKSKITKKDKVYIIKKKLLLYKYPDINFVEID